jgi:hypothetical protein
MPLLQQSTPSSRRSRWQGTRSAFVDLVHTLEGCLHTASEESVTLHVEAGGYEGPLGSSAALRDELTEAMWLASDDVRIGIRSEGHDGPNMVLLLGTRYVAPLVVAYHGGTPQSREVLRVLVERALPAERAAPVRRWWLTGLLVGLVFSGSLLLIGSRIPKLGDWHISHGLRVAFFVYAQVFQVVGPMLLTRFALGAWWFPALERLPDSGRTRWDSARRWVIFGSSAWLAIVLAMLALPVRWSSVGP